MNRFLRLSLAALLALSAGAFIHSCSDSKDPGTPRAYTYKVKRAYPHDRSAYTQGLAVEHGILYEGTGIRGRSTLRKVELETGRILQTRKLTEEFFGEGLTVCGSKIIQLTWQSRIGFVYDKDSLKLLRRFTYATEGWGITHDGSRLIMSDGSSVLRFLDPDTFETNGHVEVRDGDIAVRGLNELEFVEGLIYANVWPTDRMVIIAPKTGRVTGWIYMRGLSSLLAEGQAADVLNGIAYDSANDRLFVTGKLWSGLFEIEVVPLK